jgi:undecaprenyl phosphate N,N'-diacetylbacillosamine 1-phosphate transferase
MYKKYFKRPLDIICSFLALIILSPVLLITALLVRIKLGSPVIFKQERPGLNEKIFTLYKFRTMTDKRDEEGNLLPDELRHTKFGKFLRSTSLDELPELWNILKGDMSVVGPRPLVVQYLPYYTEEERKRHSIRPGLTGLAQIKGRNFLSWEQIFLYDLQYMEKITLVGDISIIANTVIRVIRKQDIVDITSAKTRKDGLLYIEQEGHQILINRSLNEEREK